MGLNHLAFCTKVTYVGRKNSNGYSTHPKALKLYMGPSALLKEH